MKLADAGSASQDWFMHLLASPVFDVLFLFGIAAGFGALLAQSSGHKIIGVITAVAFIIVLIVQSR